MNEEMMKELTFAEGERTMKYDVYIYPIVRLKVSGIEAANQCEAIKIACDSCDFEALLSHPEYEYVDEIAHFLVDEENDPEHKNSRWHDGIDCSFMNTELMTDGPILKSLSDIKEKIRLLLVQQIAVREDLVKKMVGDLYPCIIDSEIRDLSRLLTTLCKGGRR